jgi:glycosyltransferase involved in cell wall biosynthesis
VGTRWPRKNFSLAVEAFRKVNEANAFELAVTGKFGWGVESTVPGASLTGYVDQQDLSALYSAAELFLMPSRHEGFGIPMLEAWRCGTPVLCSSGGALPEIAGTAAFVEESWEADEWAGTIKRILGDAGKLKAMRQRGEEREKQFTWDKAARETLALYRKVARDRA